MVILTLDQIVRYLSMYGIDISIDLLTSFEKALLFGIGNIFWLLLLFLIFYVLYKVFSRIINFIF